MCSKLKKSNGIQVAGTEY